MSSFIQGPRPILLTTPLGADKLLLKSFHGEERISKLFHFTLELQSQDHNIDFTKIVGKSVTLSIQLAGGGTQYLNGIVGRFVQSGSDKRLSTYYADLHPWLWLLTMSTDCRIFQNLSAPEIIKKVFSEAGFTDFTDSLTGTYAAREYCVQYMESSFDFVCRLMEEEGIFYFFTHDSSAHKLILADGAGAYQPCEGLDKATLNKEASQAEDIITSCDLEQQVTPGKYKTDDYNFETPTTDLLATASGDDDSRSVYEYPGMYAITSDGEKRTNIRLESLEVPGKSVSGTSYCWAFRPGYRFTLAGHARDDANAEYVLTSVSHRASQKPEYTNSFEAIPSSVVFRPPRTTPRTLIHGSQTATVVGKAGEEIWTDKYGRVIVQFHWDQSGQNDEKSSCWIRVAHGWAGKQWGTMFVPRIGQEVIVSFLEGNPDRPIVTGCVYNAEQTVPYALPAEQTKSTIKSNSSKGGGGFNEVRFEDKKGSEEVFIQAQKDMTISVLNNHTETVAGNYSLKVSGNLTIDVTGSVLVKAGTSLTNNAGTALTNQAGTSLENKAGTTMTNEAQASQTVDGGGLLIVKGGLVKIN